MKRPDFTDQVLIEGLIKQDDAVVRKIYQLFFPGVRHWIHQNSGNDEDAQDVFQDTILVLFQKVREKDFTLNCSLNTYICAIARIIWLKELEKRKQYTQHIMRSEKDADITADILEQYEHNERMFLYRNHFEKLSPDCRKVLTLFNEGKSITEITRIMGYSSEQHTKNRRYRCKLSLINSIRSTYGYYELGNEEDEAN